MGNHICRARRDVVEERYTRPQRLVRQPSNVDYKKLKKLILSQKLAPCFDGLEDCPTNSDLEECPICFFYYPSLNRSRCCSKGICTECFLQMNPSNAIRPAQCPFCKTSSYAVEYRGAKTQEEKGLEQAEEQKVIEAKIRMRFQETQVTEQVTPSNLGSSLLDVRSPIASSEEHPDGLVEDPRDSDISLHAGGMEGARSPFLNAWNERHAEFGLDLEEIMLMEAIWQSIQIPTQHSSECDGMGECQSETYGSNQSISFAERTGQEAYSSLDSITGGVAVAIARLAERNILRGGTAHLTQEDDQTSQSPNVNSTEDHDTMFSTISHGPHLHRMGLVRSVEDSEFNEDRSEHDCLASSTTDDDNLDSLSAYIEQENEGSENEFASDENLPMEEEIDSSSSFSSVHTISDVSYGSPNSSENFGSPNHSLLQDPLGATRHQLAFAESYS